MIHVETETLRQSSVLISRIVEDMWESISVLRSSTEQLDIVWEGDASSREAIDGLRSLTRGLKLNVDALSTQAHILTRQANQWEEADQYWSVVYARNQER